MVVVVNVLYPSGNTFDLEYYEKTHMPFMADEFKPYGLKGYRVVKYLGTPDPTVPAQYSVQSTLEFESVEQVREAFTQAGPKVMDGLKKVSDVAPQVIVGEVTSSA